MLHITADGAGARHDACLRAGSLTQHSLPAPLMLVIIGSVHPSPAVGRQSPVAAAAGIVAADVLAVGERKADIQRVAVTEIIVGKPLAGIEC